MRWHVWREGGDRWKCIWPWMDAATKAHLEARGYTVQQAKTEVEGDHHGHHDHAQAKTEVEG